MGTYKGEGGNSQEREWELSWEEVRTKVDSITITRGKMRTKEVKLTIKKDGELREQMRRELKWVDAINIIRGKMETWKVELIMQKMETIKKGDGNWNVWRRTITEEKRTHIRGGGN